ncbi:unnamed protein product [Protopolystoma xenopodis]|uniref:Uncharacterized protein n=1 Tax=Protopolystoma xenopodis TaxID=117903 RepID=A0A3S5FHB5_9PLAT|nr:unnamed protein product [Protopolystoma xenopodis]
MQTEGRTFSSPVHTHAHTNTNTNTNTNTDAKKRRTEAITGSGLWSQSRLARPGQANVDCIPVQSRSGRAGQPDNRVSSGHLCVCVCVCACAGEKGKREEGRVIMVACKLRCQQCLIAGRSCLHGIRMHFKTRPVDEIETVCAFTWPGYLLPRSGCVGNNMFGMTRMKGGIDRCRIDRERREQIGDRRQEAGWKIGKST